MQDVVYIEEVNQAAVLLSSLRVDLLKQMAEPRSCPELAEFVGETPQKVYYHVKALERAGLVKKVSERRVRGTVEGRYQAKGRSYWLSPGLVGRIGGRGRAQDQFSLGFLLTLAEELQADIGHLAEAETEEIPSLGLSAEIHLRDSGRRAAFLQELQHTFEVLARKYGARGPDEIAHRKGQSFRLVLACYPKSGSRRKGRSDEQAH
ncbi:MAG: helix-turn-helix transcriptional regulator [Deltaproteobacteria bacterium]|nr:helix-turn-helix transcriptional regulator [Deltaproteobacteria bacterium]